MNFFQIIKDIENYAILIFFVVLPKKNYGFIFNLLKVISDYDFFVIHFPFTARFILPINISSNKSSSDTISVLSSKNAICYADYAITQASLLKL